MTQTRRSRPGEGGSNSDQAGRQVVGQPSADLLFEVRPLRRMDLAHCPAVRTHSYWDALVAAGRMRDHGCSCIVWQRLAPAAVAHGPHGEEVVA